MPRIKRIPGGAQGRCKTVVANGLVWTVGTAQEAGATVGAQTRALLAKLEQQLVEAGTEKRQIVDAMVYLTDMSKKAEMDAEWNAWVDPKGWPCRACVGTDLAPGDLVEIKLTAVMPEVERA